MQAFKDPEIPINIHELDSRSTELDIDAQIGSNMFSEATAEVKAMLYSIEHWQYVGVTSAPKMLSFLRTKIYRKSSAMYLAKYTELTPAKVHSRSWGQSWMKLRNYARIWTC